MPDENLPHFELMPFTKNYAALNFFVYHTIFPFIIN
jgi:hypothetical protein